MKRVSLNNAQTVIKEFVRGLSINADGVQLELDGKIVCEVLPPQMIAAGERAALISRGRLLAEQARARNKGVPAHVIEREVREAVKKVRGSNGR